MDRCPTCGMECEIVGKTTMHYEPRRAPNTEIESLKNKVKELECALDAWHTIFGTTQLTHAQARLEKAEKDAVKAPKNELVRIDAQQLRECLYNNGLRSNHINTVSTHALRENLIYAICSKFGSSGKRSMSELAGEVSKAIMGHACMSFNDSKDLAQYVERIIKEFSTAEVSEEALEKAHSTAHMEWMNYDRNCNLQQHNLRMNRDAFMAKALKAELDGGK